MKKIVFIIVLVFVMVMAAWAWAGQFAAPLPSKVKITPPSPDIPQEIAGFSGTWYGFWDNGQATALAVTKVEPAKDGAYKGSVIYSWGPNPQGGSGGDFSREKAIVEPGRLIIKELSFSSSSTKKSVSYRLGSDGKVLEVEFKGIEKGVVIDIGYATLQRSQPDAPSLSSLFNDPPMPIDVGKRIISPSPNFPPEIAGLSGIWQGFWNNGRPVALVVEKIEPPIAIAVYSWGDHPQKKDKGWVRHEWKMESNKLVDSGPGGRTFTFVLKSNGELQGTLSGKDFTPLYAILQKR